MVFKPDSRPVQISFIDSLILASQIELSLLFRAVFKVPFLVRSILSHCLIYKVHAPPFFPAGFQSTMTVRPSQELFSFPAGSKGLRPRPLRGDSLLNIPPAFSFVNTFFPLFSLFFSPFFLALNLVLFPPLLHIIYTVLPAGVLLEANGILNEQVGDPDRLAFPPGSPT